MPSMRRTETAKKRSLSPVGYTMPPQVKLRALRCVRRRLFVSRHENVLTRVRNPSPYLRGRLQSRLLRDIRSTHCRQPGIAHILWLGL